MHWYFDFVSPYAYLQLERHYDWLVTQKPVVKPILFAALLEQWGQRGPAEIAPKRVFTYRQTQWIADRDGIPLRYPARHPFNPLRFLRLAVALEDDLDAIRTIFRALWREGQDADSPALWSTLASQLKIDNINGLISAQPVKDRLRRNTDEALVGQIFGVPSLVVDGKTFWGYDATAMAMDELRKPGTFDTEEMRRLETLPVGASRATKIT
jgi:2-hydroxychromene-2-carboxylate isomerase